MGNVTLSAGRVDSAALAGNAFVQRFISPEHLDARDPFWNQMLSFQVLNAAESFPLITSAGKTSCLLL